MYGRVISELWDGGSGCQSRAFGEEGRRLLISMLGFTRCLLEYCSSRNLFASYEHLNSLLASQDTGVVEATLELLILPARKLEAQQSLRKTFQETIGVDLLAILGRLNHPPFIEFQGVRSKRVDMTAFRPMAQVHSSASEVVRMLSMAIYLLFMSTLDIELDSSLFSVQPTVIGDTARRLSVPVPGAPTRLETAMVSLLRAALKVASKGGEVVYALSLSAGHGPIASITRVVCEALREGLAQAYHQFFLSAFLDLLTSLALSFEADISLAQSGCVEELLRAIGNCDPQQYKLMERLLTVLDLLLHRLQEAIDIFFTSDGLHAVVSQIVRLTLDLPEGTAALDHSQASLLNSHLRLIDRLLGNAGGDDRLRNLSEGSLFKALRVVFARPALFPAETFSFALSILSAFIHHEPTSLAFLQEQGVPQALLANLHSTEVPLPALGDLICKLPQAFSALCLNSLGVEQFAGWNPMRKLLFTFLDPDTYLKPLKSHMAANELGRGIDEFMRHQPAFRDETIAVLLEVLDGLAPLLQAQRQLCHLSAEGPPDVPGVVPLKEAQEMLRRREAHPGLVMFDLFSVTLEGILQSPGHAKAFLHSGGLDRLFSLYSRPGLPFDFPARPESHSIAHLFRLLGETAPEPTGVDEGPLPSVLTTAWKHVFACSPRITDLFLAHREANQLASPFFKPCDPPTLAEDEVFEAMCSLQAILGLLSDLYLQHSFLAVRQAQHVLPGLTTAEGEAAIIFLSLLLGACVTEGQLVKQALPTALLESIRALEKIGAAPDDAASVTNPVLGAFKSARMVLWVTGKLPGLIMNLLGGVSRMLGLQSSSLSLRRPSQPLSESSLQQVSSLLANCLANNVRGLTGAPPESIESMLGLASSLFFDETSSRVILQVIPLTTFAHIGGLDDLSACIHQSYGSERILQMFLGILGRVTSAQAYRGSSWEDLGSVGFPSGLRDSFALAGRTAQWVLQHEDPIVASNPVTIRLALALATNLLMGRPVLVPCKPYEATFYDLLGSTLQGLGSEAFPLTPAEQARGGGDGGGGDLIPAFAWLRDPTPLLVETLMRKAMGMPELTFDVCQLLHYVLQPGQLDAWFKQTHAVLSTSGDLSKLCRMLAIMAHGKGSSDVLEHIVKANPEASMALTQLETEDGSDLLLAAQLAAAMSAGILPLGVDGWLQGRLARAMSVINASQDAGLVHAALTMTAAGSRLSDLDPTTAVPALLLAAMKGFDGEDVRHRSMLSLAMLTIRHQIERAPVVVVGGEGEPLAYLELLMEPELIQKYKVHAHRRLKLAAFLPGPEDLVEGGGGQMQAEAMAARDGDAFFRAIKRCFTLTVDDYGDEELLRGDLALEEEEELIQVDPRINTLERKKALLETLYRTLPVCKEIASGLLSAFLTLPALPPFASAAESVEAEQDEAVVQPHLSRMTLLLAMAELTSAFPAFHTALISDPQCEQFLRCLFDQVVPCGDLAMSSGGGQGASLLFVNGPVWVDFFLGQLCLGSALPGLPAPLDLVQGNVRFVVRILAEVLSQRRPLDHAEGPLYAWMSRVWCLSMTVYSMLNMRGPLHKQTEAVQAAVAKYMLEFRMMSILSELLAGLKADWPGHAMVSAKLILNLETLAKHARALMAKRPHRKHSEGDDPAGAAVADVPAAEEIVPIGIEEAMSTDGSTEDDDSNAPMAEEEFGYAHSSSDMSISSDDEDDELMLMGTSDDSDADGGTIDSDTDDDDDDEMDIDLLSAGTNSDMSTEGSSEGGDSSFSTTEASDSEGDEDSVHIFIEPATGEAIIGDGVLSDESIDEDDFFHDYEEEDDEVIEDAVRRRADDILAEEGFIEDYDSDGDDDDGEDDEEGFDMLSGSSASEGEGGEEERGLVGGTAGGEGIMSGISQLFRRHRHRPDIPMLDISASTVIGGPLGIDGITPFNAATATKSSAELYDHPLMGRDAGAPACSSATLGRPSDLTLFALPFPGTPMAVNPSMATPYRMLPSALTGPFRRNREVLRNPGVVPTQRRWQQEARLFFGPGPDQVALFGHQIQERVRTALRATWDQEVAGLRAEAAACQAEQKEVPVVPSALATTASSTAATTTASAESTVRPATPLPPQDYEDVGPDPEFLLALPFDMRGEVIQQYLANERRPAIATALGAANIPVRLTIRPAFLQRLPDDLRQEYQRLSDRDVERYNRRVSATREDHPAEEEVEYYDDIDDEEEELMMIEEMFGAAGPRIGAPQAAPHGGFLEQLRRSLQDVRAANRARPAAVQAAPPVQPPAGFIQRLQQGLRAGPMERIEVRVHDPSGAEIQHGRGGGAGDAVAAMTAALDFLVGAPPPINRGGRANALGSPSRGGAALLEGRVSPLAPSILSVEPATLATLLCSYYEPTMSDKRTHHKLFTSLASLPLAGSGTCVREELVGLLILVLETMPVDLEEVSQVLLLRKRKAKDDASGPSTMSQGSLALPSPPQPSIVILQRTLQLLSYLVSHDDATKHFFTRPAASTWTIRRKGTLHEVKYPIVLLLACLEKGPILQVGLLVEFLLSLLAAVSGPIRALVQRAEEKVGPAPPLPVIPVPFLHALVKALGASELTPKALGHCTSTFQNLSKLSGISTALLAELGEASLRVCESAAKDLGRLIEALKHLERPSGTPEASHESISGALSGTLSGSISGTPSGTVSGAVVTSAELNAALKALSSPTAAQVRLLRLMKMSLVLLAPPSGHGSATTSTLPSTAADTAGILSGLRRAPWAALTARLPEALGLIEGDPGLLHVAMGILPSLETFFLHHRLVSEGGSSTTTTTPSDIILGFAEAHKKLLNSLIRSSPALLTSGSFQVLTQAPRILDFDNKRSFFRSQVAALRKASGVPASTGISLNVRRGYIFEDSYHQLIGRTGDELRAAKLQVKFHGEDGVDAGGVSREWYTELCKKMFNPDNGLFLPSASDSVTLQPNRMSWVNPDHLQFFAFVGRILGKAIVDQRLLDCHFTRSFYKHMLGLPVDIRDLEAIDPDYWKSLQWILENDITDVLDLTFATETEEFGLVKLVELKAGGADLEVTQANKAEYVRLVTEYRLTTAIKPQIDAVLLGLHALIPAGLLAVFTETELELLISGLPDLDLDDWRANTEYRSYTIASPQVQWFWRAVRSFDGEERAKLVQFVTGTAKVPLEGWAHLQGSSGRQRFAITKDFGPTHRLPSAHTCFNQLDLPAYESYEDLRSQLLKAITEGATGFGLV